MGPVSGVVTYVVLWWLVFFMVLPWGVSRAENPEPGHEVGAPDKPRLWLKVGVTTLVSAVLLAIVWAVIDAGWITFREPRA
ncbi:MAG: DUF1467 family protein [Alphaproteobacteria bacterium]|nr:DUF1467 family protein [Alphaproteobacteria bacterium]